MKPFVFLIFPAHGHINPTLPIAKELVGLGRRVIYFATEEVKEKILNTGAEYRRYRGIGIDKKNVGMLWNPVRFFCFLIRASRLVATAHAGEIAALRPECIFYDSLMAAGKIIARHLKGASKNSMKYDTNSE